MSTTTTPDLRAVALEDLDTILAAAQTARLDAQLVAEWEAQS